MRHIVYYALAAGSLAFATPALAKPAITNIGGCTTDFTTPNALACDGYFTTNLLNNNSDDVAAQQAAVAALGYSWDGDWNALVNAGNTISDLNGSTILDFGQMLYGVTIIGAHFGGITDPITANNVSVFWKFDFGTTGVDHITLADGKGSSNAALYLTGQGGVPEPATWAMMLLGFGGAGAVLRRKRREISGKLQLA